MGFPLGFNEDKAPEPGNGSGDNSNASVPDQGTSRGLMIVGDRNLEIEGAPNEQAAIAEQAIGLLLSTAALGCSHNRHSGH